MKITVCDICKKDGKLTETKKYFRVKNHPEFRLDFCLNCKDKIPKEIERYKDFVHKIRGF